MSIVSPLYDLVSITSRSREMNRVELRIVFVSPDESQVIMGIIGRLLEKIVPENLTTESVNMSLLTVGGVCSPEYSAALAFIKKGKERGCTDRVLAGKIGISEEHLSRIKNDHLSLSQKIAARVEEVMAEMDQASDAES